MGSSAIFWDRDNTLIADPGYISHPDEVQLQPGSADVVRRFCEAGYKNIIVTNQSGIARGLLDEPTLEQIHDRLRQLMAESGATIDAIYYCPHHVDGVIEEYKKECYCRKPNPGMIEQAARDFGIDLESSFVIGDKSSDIEAGRRSGCKTILLTAEDHSVIGKETAAVSDYTAPGLYEAVKWLVKPSRPKTDANEI